MTLMENFNLEHRFKTILGDVIEGIKDTAEKRKFKERIDKIESRVLDCCSDAYKGKKEWMDSLIVLAKKEDIGRLSKDVDSLKGEYECLVQSYRKMNDEYDELRWKRDSLISEIKEKEKELKSVIESPRGKAYEVFKFYSILKDEALKQKDNFVKVQLLKNAGWLASTLSSVDGIGSMGKDFFIDGDVEGK